MSGQLGPEGVAKAMAACTNCHQPSRVQMGWLWVCMACDHGWAIHVIRTGREKP